MALKQYNPTSPGRRFMTTLDFSELTAEAAGTGPHRAAAPRPAAATARAGPPSGSGAAATSGAYRMIDFRRDKPGVPAKVTAIEYDPNRSARIALLAYADGEKRYILAPDGIKVGQAVLTGRNRRHPARQRSAAARRSRRAP